MSGYDGFATAEYSKDSVAIPVTIFLLCCLALALGFVASKLLKVQGERTPFLMTGFLCKVYPITDKCQESRGREALLSCLACTSTEKMVIL